MPHDPKLTHLDEHGRSRMVDVEPDRSPMAHVGQELTHLDEHGRSRMVDVGQKPITARRAAAQCRVQVSDELAAAIRDQRVPKGNLFEVARLAGIQAAKRTDELIPLCHTLPLDDVDIEVALIDDAIHIRAQVRTQARTGVEMEALTAAAVTALTVVDMGKAIDKRMRITDLRVTAKSGGQSGDYEEAP